MTTDTLLFDCETIRGRFQQWHAEHESAAAQLSESLAALAAYQSHLDTWQQQLGQERDKLRSAREQFDRDRVSIENTQGQSLAEATAELTAAREKNATLTAALLDRTEELRTLDGRRSELVTELELVRARENELRAALEEHKQTREQERSQWTEELRQLRELLEQHVVDDESAFYMTPPEQPQTTPQPAASEAENVHRHTAGAENAADTAVLGSILQQFGKLRQQRALDRPTFKKAR